MTRNRNEFDTNGTAALDNVTPITSIPSRTSTTSSSSSSTTTTTTRNTEPGVSQHDREVILQAYNQVIGDMTLPVARWISNMVEIGVEVGVILYAIEETAWAKRPSAHYMRAIIARLRGEGITTMEQLVQQQMEQEQLKAEKKRLEESGEMWWI